MIIGRVLKIPFPYVQKEGFKVRPAVVIGKAPGHMICAAISSNDLLRKGDVFLQDWKQAGLFRPSKVKLMILTTFSSHNLEIPITHIGYLSQCDLQNVLNEFKNTWKGEFLGEHSSLAI